MKTYLTSGIAAFVVSLGFAGAAAAQDMYYDNPPYYQYDPQGRPTANPQNLDDNPNRNIDPMGTGSINQYGGGTTWLNNSGADTDIDRSQDPGDYYDGVLRPQD